MTSHLRPLHRSASLALVLGVLALLALSGCIALQAEPGSKAPEDMTLKFHIATTDSRLSYYEINHDGDLYFGGGKDAMTSTAKPMGTLTAEQRQAIWRLITDNRLADAPSAGMFTKGDKVTYDLSVQGGAGGFSLHTVDARTPGLADLEKLLIDYKGNAQVKQMGF